VIKQHQKRLFGTVIDNIVKIIHYTLFDYDGLQNSTE
jgi:hypothetical protein